MYTRELQNNMSILNVFKQTGQVSKENNSMSFSDVMSKRYQSNVSNQSEVAFYNKQTDHTKKTTFQPATSNQDLKNNEPVIERKAAEHHVKDTKADTTHTDSKTNSDNKVSKKEEVITTTDDEQTLRDALEKKLKVSAEELDQLMALMDVDLTELQELVNSESVDINLLQEICTTLSQIEIASSLDTNSTPDKTLVDKLSNQFKNLMESLQNQQNGADENVEKTVSEFIDKIETLLKQSDELSTKSTEDGDKLIEKEIDSSGEDATVLWDRIKALTTKLEDESKTEVKPMTIKPDVPLTTQVKANSETESDETLNKVDASKLVDTSGEKNSKENSADDKSERSETVMTVSKEGDLVITKSDSETNSILDQITLKQPNSITNGTQTSASSALRANIFSQVMDAVKTNIKLDDNGSHMLMKLNPEQLGSVELKISIHKGVVLAEINVENEMVKATVESNLDDLKHSLSQKGYQLNQINVSIDSGKKEQEQQFTFNKGSKSKRGLALDEVSDLEALFSENTNYQDDPYDTSTINYYA